jgi:hypothetical protein
VISVDLYSILKIIIFLVFCLGCVLVGSLVGIHKKEIIPPVTEECKKGICPIPEEWKGNDK